MYAESTWYINGCYPTVCLSAHRVIPNRHAVRFVYTEARGNLENIWRMVLSLYFVDQCPTSFGYINMSCRGTVKQ